MVTFSNLKVGDCVYGMTSVIYKYKITKIVAEGSNAFMIRFRIACDNWSFDVPVTVHRDQSQDGDLFSCVEALLEFLNEQ